MLPLNLIYVSAAFLTAGFRKKSSIPYEGPQQRLEKRLRNGSETVRTSMDGTALTGWMYLSTLEDGTPGAPWVAQILGCSCTGALAP